MKRKFGKTSKSPKNIMTRIVEFKLKNMYYVLEFNQSQWLKPYCKFNTKKIIGAEKNGAKDGKHCTS